ncbi:SIR2 family NAD-dependent protein deacylase [Methylocella silvestris]|uniref:SIR2 family protein n=1 Tax=Methylocella silvestris TaxID=199596 RepID=A0A2J7TLP0_METSI|nr:SIR2 family protein [Methylocella silvestris]PNG27688.1 SIR2 family protein [Methylocella silvestris]
MIDQILAAMNRGEVVPYLGPGVLALAGEAAPPHSPETLVTQLTAAATVPHKIRNNLTAAAQFIENFKHRKTVAQTMTKAFTNATPPTTLHTWLATRAKAPIIVNAWYDDLLQKAFAGRADWGMAQGVSQAEHFGEWVHYFRADGSQVPGVSRIQDGSGAKAPADAPDETLKWTTLIYQPIGSVSPAANYIISDSDYVEVLTEIDIQTPIPEAVQSIRRGKSFLFVGCRFSSQIERSFARQIMKRSSDRHWAVMPGPLTRNEERFMREQNIEWIDQPLDAFVAKLTDGAASRPQMASIA